MVAWVIGADSISPIAVQGLTEQATSLFNRNDFGRCVTAVRATVLPDGREGVVVTFRSVAEIVNDDDQLLAVVEEVFAPLNRSNAARCGFLAPSAGVAGGLSAFLDKKITTAAQR